MGRLTLHATHQSLLDACQRGDAAKAAELIEGGANVNCTGIGGVTALMVCCMRGNAECAQLLLANNAAVNSADNDGDTALMRACRHDYPIVAKLLCSYGASRDVENRHGCSAVEDACEVNEHLWHWLVATRSWCSPLHYLEVITTERAGSLLCDGAINPLARGLDESAPSPLELARGLERAGCAPAGSPAHLVLEWWRERLRALAMGTHPRLGADSIVSSLAGIPEVLELIVERWKAACIQDHVHVNVLVHDHRERQNRENSPARKEVGRRAHAMDVASASMEAMSIH